MKLLIFSLDRAILQDGSSQQKKIIEYPAFSEEIHVILFSFSDESPLQIHSRVFVYPTSHYFRYSPWYFVRAFIIARRIIRSQSFVSGRDVISAQDVFPTGIIAYIVSRIFGIPLQIQVHIDFFKPRFIAESLMNRLYYMSALFLLPRADAVRAVSLEIKEYLVRTLRIPAEKITVLPTFCDVRAIIGRVPRTPIPNGYSRYAFLIFAIARFVPQKNLGVCIRAMEMLSAYRGSIALVLVGSGSEESQLRSMALQSAMRENIFFEPWTDDVVSYLRTADVFLFPSWYEGWGLAVIEAMACGVPPIATGVGCVPELIEDGKSGYIVQHGDSAAIAHHIEALYKNPSMRLAMGAAARDSVMTRLPADKAAYLKNHGRALAIALYGN